jgi:hypothetical protein
MKRLFGMALMGAMVLAMVWVSAHANTPHMANTEDPHPKSKTKKMKWVHRRHVDDPNGLNGSVATVVHLWDASPSDDKPMVKGILTFWMGKDSSGYTDKHEYFLHAVDVKNGGEDNYKHESCTWMMATPLDLMSTDPLIDVHASLFKAHGHGKGGKGTAERRLVIRFKFPHAEAPSAKKGRGKAAGDCCDDEPDDDVLEEEDVTTPDPPDGC